MKKNNYKKHTKEQRRLMQLIRRRMLQKNKPSKKIYNRKTEKKDY